MTTSSIYAQTLGPSFIALAPVLKRLHGLGNRHMSGDLRISVGRHPLARPLLWLAGLPGRQTAAACDLRLEPDKRGECWRRDFGRWKFITHQSARRANTANAGAQTTGTRGEILERFGPLTLHLRLQVKGQSLWVRSSATRLFGITVPPLLGIEIVAWERPIDESSLCCNIRIRLPWLGGLLKYRGTLRFHELHQIPESGRRMR